MAGVMQVDLGDLDVPIGTNVQIEFISPPGRYMVKVLGNILKSSLIVSCPKLNGKNILVRDSQVVNVRLMLSTHVCAFSSKIAKSYMEPAAHLHIAYPSYVETSEVRQAARVEARLISNIEPNTLPTSISESSSAIIIDLSLGGAKLISKEDFGSVNQTMRLACNVKIGPYSHILKLDCEIRSQEIQMLEQVQASLVDNDFLNRMGVEYFYVYGVRFIDVVKEVGIPLMAFILETQFNKAK
ncbi:flagellar brake protein [Marinomonas sp. UCMA 3892]|jgi:c-di-GMP-binding flagellar brake protein YcgR|uniref:Type III secretion system flagellar brake protein YcgR PilZN domain-containing protein n=1 Tax=Marinomonas sp. (strain MWYL1) TaxID=400668 RepID=A6VXM2_MARMS|nr:flagellar brake protein [Marinomonas sp. UCMA 3892]NLV00599.1 flagellar brake protein [Marinomonas sp. UCMA 3892]